MSFLPLPNRFDLNEWCAIGLTLICLITIYFLPNRFKGGTVLVIWLFNINLVKVVDFTFGVKPFNFYDFMDQPKFELIYAITHYTLYPGVAYIIFYFYDRLKLKGIRTFFYLLFISAILIGLEWVATHVKILEYVGDKWKLYYSYPVYVLIFWINIILLKFVQKLLR